MSSIQIKKRFDGFLPIVIDVETGGSDAQHDALLEVAAIKITHDQNGYIPAMDDCFHAHVQPFSGAKLHAEALAVNRIDPFHPFRLAIDEREALTALFKFARDALTASGCRRAILVGHNAHFDLGFIQAAAKRCKLDKTNPFHTYTVFDTATMGGLFYGKTVLAKALKAAKIAFNRAEAHSAMYDTKVTAELFCQCLNSVRLPKGD